MSEEKRGFINQIWGCMASPRQMFKSIEGEDLRKAMALILILAAVSALAGYGYASELPVTMPERFGPSGRSGSPTRFGPPRQSIDLQAFRRSILVFRALRDGLSAVAGWLVLSVVLHLSASMLAGKGSLRRMLALTGFASIPLILQQLLRVIDAYTISGQALLSVAAAKTSGQPLISRLLNEAFAVFTVFGLWTFALTIVAVSVNYRVSIKRATFASAFAYLVFILLRLFSPL